MATTSVLPPHQPMNGHHQSPPSDTPVIGRFDSSTAPRTVPSANGHPADEGENEVEDAMDEDDDNEGDIEGSGSASGSSSSSHVASSSSCSEYGVQQGKNKRPSRVAATKPNASAGSLSSRSTPSETDSQNKRSIRLHVARQSSLHKGKDRAEAALSVSPTKDSEVGNGRPQRSTRSRATYSPESTISKTSPTLAKSNLPLPSSTTSPARKLSDDIFSGAPADGQNECGQVNDSQSSGPTIRSPRSAVNERGVATRSKTKSLSPTKLSEAQKVPLGPAAAEESRDDTVSVMSNEDVVVVVGGALGLKGMKSSGALEPVGNSEGDVPMPKGREETARAKAAGTERKTATRRRRKGDVEPEDPAVIEARKQRHALIDSALSDLDRQEMMIRTYEHPLLVGLYDELAGRRAIRVAAADKQYELARKEATHVRDQETMISRCQWHSARLDLKEKLVRSNVRQIHAARRERTSFQFARLPPYLQVGRIPFDAGAGWRFDPGPLLSAPNADVITFIGDDNVPAKRRRVEQGINGLGDTARRDDLEKMGLIRPRVVKKDIRSMDEMPSSSRMASAPAQHLYDLGRHNYSSTAHRPVPLQQPHNMLPAQYQPSPLDYREQRPSLPWWQPSVFPTSTPSSALPPATSSTASSQSHHHHHKRHHHHHHARPYMYTSQPPAPAPRPYYDPIGTAGKPNPVFRNMLAS